MQDVGEDTTRTAKRSRQRVGNRPEDEPPRRQFGQIGDHRRDQIAEVELASLDELADCILGRGEGPDQRLTDIAADVARLGGVVGERGGHCAPAGRSLISPVSRRRPGFAPSRPGTSGSGYGVAQFSVQGIRRTGGVCQRGTRRRFANATVRPCQ